MAPLSLPQPEVRGDGNDDYDETDDIDYVIHDGPFIGAIRIPIFTASAQPRHRPITLLCVSDGLRRTQVAALFILTRARWTATGFRALHGADGAHVVFEGLPVGSRLL